MEEKANELKPLSKKHQVVLDNYLILFHQTKAYRAAYPSSSETSARTAAARLFADDNFSAHLQARLSELHMSADEALKRMADIARGDIGDFVGSFGGIDLAEAKDKGLTPLVKKIKQRTVTKIGKKDDDEDVEVHDLEIELYSAQSALETILKASGKLQGDAPVINVAKGYIGWTPENWSKENAEK